MPTPSKAWEEKYNRDGKYVNKPHSGTQFMPAISNESFSVTDKFFRICCDMAGVKPTAAQARKYRHHRGSAYQKIGEARKLSAVA